MDRRDSAFFSANRLYPTALANSRLPKHVKTAILLCSVICVILFILGVLFSIRPDLVSSLGPEQKKDKA